MHIRHLHKVDHALVSTLPSAILSVAILLSPLTTSRLRAQELAIAPPGPTRLTFDIATIRPSKPHEPNEFCYVHSMSTAQGYLAHCINVKLMMSLMYKIPVRQITGLPEWVGTQEFDIEAKADKAYNLDDLHTMFQNLLVDRFGLKFHTEVRQGNIYALNIDSSGLKMKPNTDPDDFQIPITGQADGLHGKRVPMNYLCWWLGSLTRDDERPVINMTGLTGNYDYVLSFLSPLPPGYDTSTLPPGFLDRPNLYDALRQQLGLKLNPQKGPVTYLVVDHIEKPSEN